MIAITISKFPGKPVAITNEKSTVGNTAGWSPKFVELLSGKDEFTSMLGSRSAFQTLKQLGFQSHCSSMLEDEQLRVFVAETIHNGVVNSSTKD